MNELNKRDWSQAALARTSGLSRSAISNYISDYRIPDKRSLIAIANAFNIPPNIVFSAAGLKSPIPDEDAEIEEIIHLIMQLPESEREEIRDIALLKLERQERAKTTRQVPHPSEGT